MFAYFVRRAGVGEIVSRIQSTRRGLLPHLAVSSIRYVVRSLAWTRCIEGPHRLPFRDAFAARLMGDALGNIIPFVSVAVSEPSKAVFVKDRVPLMVGLSGLAIENIFYGLSVALFIFCGTTTLLLTFSLPKPLRYASIGALVVTLVIVPLAYLVIRRQSRFLSGALGYLGDRGVARNLIGKVDRERRILKNVFTGFMRTASEASSRSFALDSCFHVAGVLEVYITLSFISPVPPTLTQAFILESVNRIINVVFKFIPLRAGVDEGGTGQSVEGAWICSGIGEALAIVRKGAIFSGLRSELLLIWKRGFSLKLRITQITRSHQ